MKLCYSASVAALMKKIIVQVETGLMKLFYRASAIWLDEKL